METATEPRLSPGRGVRPTGPTPGSSEAHRTSPTNPSFAQREELATIGTLAIASTVLGVGAALIDQTYVTAAHPELYYWGWVLLAVGFVVVVKTFADNVLERLWTPLILLVVGVYGWWNVVWSLLQVWYGGELANARGEVILANFGSAWPVDHGLVEVPLWGFLASTVFGILLAPAVYASRKRTFSPKH